VKQFVKCGLGAIAAALVLLVSVPVRAQTTDVTLRVGVQPIVDVAPLYLGMAKGFFKDEHLVIEAVVAQGGGAVTAAVVSGDEQFGYGNVVSMMLAVSHGLPLQVVADGSQSIADGKHANVFLLTAPNSPIKTIRDLEGKTIGVNALKTMTELIIKEDLSRSGVDVAKVNFTEIPNPEMGAALKSSRIDAALEAEPYLTADRAAGLRGVFEPYDMYAPKITLATYFTTQQYATDHPDIVARFRRAMNRSLAYATANLRETRDVVPTYTKLAPDTVANMALVGWGTAVDMPSIAALQRSMVKFGWMPKELDLKTMVPGP
jgi:NitT/TauT family transport system substrate-binding protein